MGYGKKSKNSPTGIRTPVFHVTGEDTNQLYYWRLLNKGQDRVDEAAKGKGVGKKEERKSGRISRQVSKQNSIQGMQVSYGDLYE